jgi:hypothetical protein
MKAPLLAQAVALDNNTQAASGSSTTPATVQLATLPTAYDTDTRQVCS